MPMKLRSRNLPDLENPWTGAIISPRDPLYAKLAIAIGEPELAEAKEQMARTETKTPRLNGTSTKHPVLSTKTKSKWNLRPKDGPDRSWTPGLQIPKDGWSKLPHVMVASEAWASLSTQARDVFIFMLGKFRGHNNGKLTATLKELRQNYGWRNSPKLRAKAIQELREAKFVTEEQKASWTRPALYRLAGVGDGKEEPRGKESDDHA